MPDRRHPVEIKKMSGWEVEGRVSCGKGDERDRESRDNGVNDGAVL